MKYRRSVAGIILAAVIGLTIVGCSDNKNQSALNNNISQPSAEDNFDADITVVQAVDMVSFDPILSSDMSNVYTLANV